MVKAVESGVLFIATGQLDWLIMLAHPCNKTAPTMTNVILFLLFMALFIVIIIEIGIH